jgi:hypothetical protein
MLLLERLIEGLNIDVQPFAICRVGAGAQMAIPPFDAAMTHYVLAGRGVLTYPRGAPVDLSPGTMVMLPRNTAHEVAANGESAAMPANLQRWNQSIKVLETGWYGTGVVLICGLVRATYQGTHGVFDYLPAPIIEHAKRGHDGRAHSAVSACDPAKARPERPMQHSVVVRFGAPQDQQGLARRVTSSRPTVHT